MWTTRIRTAPLSKVRDRPRRMGARRVKSLWGTWTIYSIQGSRYLSSNLPPTCRVRLCPGRGIWGFAREFEIPPKPVMNGKQTGQNGFWQMKMFLRILFFQCCEATDHQTTIIWSSSDDINWSQFPRAPLSSSMSMYVVKKSKKYYQHLRCPSAKPPVIYTIYIYNSTTYKFSRDFSATGLIENGTIATWTE